MNYVFHPAALAEYSEAALFYRDRQPGLEVRFVATIEEAVDRIVTSPEGCPILESDVRRCLTRVFPYGILYTIEPNHVLILAVMHCSREPGYWRSRQSGGS